MSRASVQEAADRLYDYYCRKLVKAIESGGEGDAVAVRNMTAYDLLKALATTSGCPIERLIRERNEGGHPDAKM